MLFRSPPSQSCRVKRAPHSVVQMQVGGRDKPRREKEDSVMEDMLSQNFSSQTLRAAVTHFVIRLASAQIMLRRLNLSYRAYQSLLKHLSANRWLPSVLDSCSQTYALVIWCAEPAVEDAGLSAIFKATLAIAYFWKASQGV